ncbi:MAG: PspA/IM30 family protein [Myxococcales bacterium]|nr:PspA/IM30 family protein [Myxococcales bacterium]
MGILSRISKVLESNVNALVERAENPAKMLDQAIEDMKKGQRDARDAIIEAKTQKRLLERKRDKAFAEVDACEQRAIQALQADYEDKARRYLELKLAAEQRAHAEDAAIEEQDRQIEQLVSAERELEQRLAQMPARRAALLARQSAAQARGAKVGAASKAQSSVAAAIEAFDRMEEKVIRAEVEAEVVTEETGPSSPELMLPSTTDADRALKALKSKLRGQLPARAEAGGEAVEDDDELASMEVVSEPAASAEEVEDSLAALKAKLGG